MRENQAVSILIILNWFQGFKKKLYFLGKRFVKAGGGGLALAKLSAKSTTFF